jgi:hypothetical protein
MRPAAVLEKHLTTFGTGLQYRKFANWRPDAKDALRPNMKPIQNSPIAKQPPEKTAVEKPCKHTRVRVVAREEDAEFVECQECGEVFESSEFKDMAIEENIQPDEA